MKREVKQVWTSLNFLVIWDRYYRSQFYEVCLNFYEFISYLCNTILSAFC
jgi:hypothetical protein